MPSARHLPRRLLLVAVLAAATSTLPLEAQVRASERSTVSQTVDGTVLTINYSRPRVRGRTDVFGREVRWGEVWTPGANWATTLEVNHEVALDGHVVPKGRYSVWFAVTVDAWTVILDPRFQRYHTEPPDSTAEQIRWTVRPEIGRPTEVLTWSFPAIRPDGAKLQFEWADRRVVIDATVPPSHPLTIAERDAQPFIGHYQWKWTDDSTAAAAVMELYYEGGMLRQRHTPLPDWYPSLQNQPMVRINDEWFIPTIVRDGKVLEMVADMVYEFTLENGLAVSFEVRDDKDNLLATGRRSVGPVPRPASRLLLR